MRTLGAAGLVAGVVLTVTLGLGYGLMVFGLAIFQGGIFALMDDNRVTKVDDDLSKFLLSLGNVAGALGTNLTGAISKIDRRSMGNLEPYANRLNARLQRHITPLICWNRFIDETGSELVHRSTKMFVDGVNLGGSPEKVGEIASSYAMNIAILRSRRNVTATPFAYLAIALHTAMAGRLIFILEVMKAFNDQLSVATAEMMAQAGSAAAQIPSLPVFQPKDMNQISVLTLGAILILTVSNTFGAKFATGGHNFKLAYYGSIMSITLGACLIVIPSVAQKKYSYNHQAHLGRRASASDQPGKLWPF